MQILKIIAGAIGFLAIGSPAFAAGEQANLIGGTYAGTTGIGESLGFQIHNGVTVRAQSGALGLGYNGTASGIPYRGAYHAVDAAALIDIRPYGGFGKITVGAVLDNNHINFDANPSANYVINGTSYSAAQTGAINGQATWHRIAPYIGTGFDTTPRTHPGFGFVLDAGAFYQGRPNVTLSTEHKPADPAFTANLEKARQDFAQRVDRARIYPVISVGTMFRF